ncbi:MAG TPA: DNA cytosine methyltransferase [Phycisphaerales bacterium]|nr:DNA cytosine methyltransferase [Phycisphaerales bacterium]
MIDLTHVDLFSGIGGFALAAKWTGFRTVALCEIKPDLRVFLKDEYPEAYIHDDAWTFPGKLYRGITLLTAGPPCQPSSVAGKRKGKKDDRWLWPATLAAVEQIQPAWIVFENPPGIGSLGLDGILAELDGKGYEVGVLDIPACAVNSPQVRHRYWIVAARTEHDSHHHLEDHRCECGDEGGEIEKTVSGMQKNGETCCHNQRRNTTYHLAYGEGVRRRTGAIDTKDREELEDHYWLNHWAEYELVFSSIDGKARRAPVGVHLVADGIPGWVFETFGNSIVPQVAAEIFMAIRATIEGE